MLLCASCQDTILDLKPLDAVSDASVWESPELLELYVNERYDELPHGFVQWAGQLRVTSLTDESYNQHQGPRLLNMYTEGTVTPTNMYLFGGFWSDAYTAIRNCNIFMENIKQDVGDPVKTAQLKAEVRFLRAFFYIELFSRYGAVPLITTTFEVGTNLQVERTPVGQIVEFVKKELTEAAADLPLVRTGNEFGKATRGAAIALKARALLYGASPLFTETDDEQKWQDVANACEELFSLNSYSLASDYKNLFIDVHNPEVIFFKQFRSDVPWQVVPGVGDSYYHAIGGHVIERDRMPNSFGGWSDESPLQNLVDKYETRKGEIPVLCYTGDPSNLDPVFNPEASDYDPAFPYQNRDPRLGYSIVVDGSLMRGREIEFWECGRESRCESAENWWNGALLDGTIRKSIDEEFDPNLGLNSKTPWIYMRLAEFYLTYAEAQYHLGHHSLASEYVNKVRSRPGVAMPPIDASQIESDLLKKIKHERDIELAFEGNRWYDARRWLDAEVEFATHAVGVEVKKDQVTGAKSYRYFVQQYRAFPKSHYLFPIPAEEINRSGLEQNPGY